MADTTEERLLAEAEPANELERQLAVIYCRLNTWCHPITGETMSQEEMDYMRGRLSLIMHAERLAPEKVKQRLWMQGKDAWTNEPTEGRS